MPAVDMTEQEIKEEVLYRLFRRTSWGARQSNKRAVESWIISKVKNNGKKVRKALNMLIKDFLILPAKKGDTISLNPRRKKEIMEIIDKAFPVYKNSTE
jgi:hypothetical protein